MAELRCAVDVFCLLFVLMKFVFCLQRQYPLSLHPRYLAKFSDTKEILEPDSWCTYINLCSQVGVGVPGGDDGSDGGDDDGESGGGDNGGGGLVWEEKGGIGDEFYCDALWR